MDEQPHGSTTHDREPPPPADEEAQIRAFYRALTGPDEVREIRIPRPTDRWKGVLSAYVDNEEKFVALVLPFTRRHLAEAIYCTLNPVDPALMARTSNKLIERAEHTTKDHEILRRTGLLVDIDPRRLTGISATDSERATALAIKDQIVRFLIDQGWSNPVVNGSSGNGGMLIYRVDLPNDAASKALVEGALKGLAARFDSEAVSVDPTVANAARIMKVPGTIAAKGDHTPARPWRVATAVIAPDAGTISREQLIALADHAEPTSEADDAGGSAQGGGQDPKDGPSSDGRDHSSSPDTPDATAALHQIRAALEAKEIGSTVKRRDGRIILDLRQCLTSADHTAGDCITIFPSGARDYRCHHDSCKDKGWQDAKVALGLSSSSSFVRSTSQKSHTAPLPVVPVFPIDILPEPVRSYVETYAAALGVPPELVAVPLLVFAGATIGNRVRIRLKPGFEQRPILYAAVVAPPGSAKSPALDAARNPLDNLQAAALNAFKEALVAWEKEVAAAKKEKKPLRPRPEPEHFFTTDATLEALAVMVAGSPGLAMVRDELVSWVKACDAYRSGRGGDRQAWLSLWAGSPLKVDRKSCDPVYVPCPVVCVVGGVQPDLLPELNDEAGRRDGFIERILWAYPDVAPAGWSEAVVSEAEHLAVLALFRTLQSAWGCPTDRPGTIVGLDPNARAGWVDWYNENATLTAEASGLPQGISAKLPNQLARLALILHCLTYPENPGLDLAGGTMADAIELVEYSRQHAHRVLIHFGAASPTQSAGVPSRIFRILDREHGVWLDRTALHRRLGGHVAAQALSDALARLEADGLIERRSVPTEGRPAEQWHAVVRNNEETEESPEKPHGDADSDPPSRPGADAQKAEQSTRGVGDSYLRGTSFDPGFRHSADEAPGAAP